MINDPAATNVGKILFVLLVFLNMILSFDVGSWAITRAHKQSKLWANSSVEKSLGYYSPFSGDGK